jgi:8-hydroxy-5-deazaflavin:NADPH oxidoreductase
MPADTRYAIVGSGNIGSALATLFGRAGVEVRIANKRGPNTISELAASAGPSVVPASLAEALACEVIFMAIPFTAVEQFGRELSDWTGKTIVDTTNAFLAPDARAERILKGRLSSHYVADVLPGARVVKAFNQLPARTLAARVPDGQGRRVVFIASDSAGASADVAKLTEALGLSAVELGKIGEGGRLIQAPNALVLRNLTEQPLP